MRLLATLVCAMLAGGVHAQAGIDALLKSAKAEGEVFFYGSPVSDVLKRIATGFTTKYGVPANFLRMPGSTRVFQRFSSEAEAGTFPADVLFSSGVEEFTEVTGKKGWLDPVSNWGVPSLSALPPSMAGNHSVVVQIYPWQLIYNTDKVKRADLPKDWTGLADPKWKGQIVASNPGAADSYVTFWAALQDRYGESFLNQVRANIRPVASGVVAVQAVGAGEAALLIPGHVSLMMEVKSKGAPVDIVGFPYTTGVVTHMMMTARSKAKHPNAARLFVNYVMSPEGNAVLNDEPGGLTIYDTLKLPKEYQPEKPGVAARRDSITKLLGF